MNTEIRMSNGDIYSGELKEVKQYYRIPHDKERLSDGSYGGDGYWSGNVREGTEKPVPEVYRLNPSQTTSIPCSWIRAWWAMNPLLDLDHFELLLDDHWMLCNGTGWPSRYNCLTGKPGDDPDDKLKPPAFHESLICGGAIVGGLKVGGILWLNSLLVDQNVPFNYTSKSSTESWIKDNPDKWYYATTVASSGNVTYSTFTGIDGNRQRLRVPILTKERVYIPLKELDILPMGFIPPESTWKP